MVANPPQSVGVLAAWLMLVRVDEVDSLARLFSRKENFEWFLLWLVGKLLTE